MQDDLLASWCDAKFEHLGAGVDCKIVPRRSCGQLKERMVKLNLYISLITVNARPREPVPRLTRSRVDRAASLI